MAQNMPVLSSITIPATNVETWSIPPLSEVHLDSRECWWRDEKSPSRYGIVIEAAARGRIHGIRSNARAKIAHDTLNEIADDLRQFPF